jgi:hypothetical protein
VVEKWKEIMQVENVNQLIKQVANKFILNLRMQLPKGTELIHDYDILREKFI